MLVGIIFRPSIGDLILLFLAVDMHGSVLWLYHVSFKRLDLYEIVYDQTSANV